MTHGRHCPYTSMYEAIALLSANMVVTLLKEITATLEDNSANNADRISTYLSSHLLLSPTVSVPTTSQQVAHTTDRSSQTQSLKKYNFHNISISQHLQKNSTKNIHQKRNYKDTSQNEHTNQTPKWRHKKQ